MSSGLNNENRKLYETVLSSPGMNEKVKINLSVSRQVILLLSRLIESGLLSQDKKLDDPIALSMPAESESELSEIHKELLSKSGLTDFYERLKNFS